MISDTHFMIAGYWRSSADAGSFGVAYIRAVITQAQTAGAYQVTCVRFGHLNTHRV